MRQRKNHNNLTIWEHVTVLRATIFRMIAVFLFSVSVVHYFHQQIIEFLLVPLDTSTLQFLSPLDPLYFILTIDFVVGLLISLPFLLLFIWFYISPAINIKWWIPFFFILAINILTLSAFIYSYLLVVPLILHFMNSITIPGTNMSLTANGYLSFFITTTLILVLIFQIPIFIFIGIWIKILNRDYIKKKRPYIYISIVIVSAIITPTTDIITLLLVSIPGVVAVELGITISGLLLQNKQVHDI